MHCQRVCQWVFLFIFAIAATAKAEPTGFTYDLFDGKTLAGWEVTRCEAKVEDGKLILVSGNGFVRADHPYADYILELDYKALQAAKYDSGIYFRCELPDPKNPRPWPTRYQVNIKDGEEGNLVGDKTAVVNGLTKKGDWNHFKLTVIGTTAALEVNGSPAWKVDGIKDRVGYLGLQAEVPLGGQYEFKNIRITELNFQSLFDGKSLTGWEGAKAPAESCWNVEDGMIHCTGAKGSWLRWKDEVGDFNFRADYKLLPGGNSGIFCRMAKDSEHQGKGGGVEIQCLDDKSDRYQKEHPIKPYQYAGSVYSIIPADPHASKPAPEWNSLEVDANGTNYKVLLNGVVVAQGDATKFPLLDERNLKGYLGLQNHSEQVWFKNLRLGPPLPK